MMLRGLGQSEGTSCATPDPGFVSGLTSWFGGDLTLAPFDPTTWVCEPMGMIGALVPIAVAGIVVLKLLSGKRR